MRVVADSREIFDGSCLVAAPHMDDGVLGCGSTISMLADGPQVHFVYATDGTRSPLPPFTRAADPALATVRAREAREALAVLGVPASNIHFLGLPDARLRHHTEELTARLTDLVASLRPEFALVPFRFDRHPDHLAVTRCMRAALARARSEAIVYEYFVYTRWQLLPRKDVRRYIGDEHLVRIDPGSHAARKSDALSRFRSQTTRFFDWQRRAILPPERVAEVSRSPEYLLEYDPALPRLEVFPRLRAWIWLVHACEPRLKSCKDGLVHLLGRG